MLFINYPSKDQWREWDPNAMKAFNYRGGYCEVNENALGDVKCLELSNWHELYLQTRFCALQADKYYKDVWISPDGKYYDGIAHEVAAEHLLKIIYGINCDHSSGDRLEDLGWIRATTSAMWEVRFNNSIVRFIRYNDNIPTVTNTEGQVT